MVVKKKATNTFNLLEIADHQEDEKNTSLSKKQLKKLKRELEKQIEQEEFQKILDRNLARVYEVPEIWMSILEFLPIVDLMNCSSLNKNHYDLIHSVNCYASILVRDFIEYDILPKSILKEVFLNDYKRLISKIVNNSVKIMKFTDKIDYSVSKATMVHVKKSFRNIYTELSANLKKFLANSFKKDEYFMEERSKSVDFSHFACALEANSTKMKKHRFSEYNHKKKSQTVIFCKYCYIEFIIANHPQKLYEKPELKKNRARKSLYNESEVLRLIPNCGHFLNYSDEQINGFLEVSQAIHDQKTQCE